MATEQRPCSRCQAALKSAPPKPAPERNVINAHYPLWEVPYSVLRQAALAGCRICLEVHNYILDPDPLSNPTQTSLLGLSEAHRERLVVEGMLKWDGDSRYDSLEFVFWGPLGDSIPSTFNSEAATSYGYIILQLFPANMVRHLAPAEEWTPGFGPLSQALLREWIASCTHGHARCTVPDQSAPKWAPSRLIDVGPAGLGPTTFAPHLVITDNALPATSPTGTCYATLSHRWMQNMPVLTTSNVNFLVTGLPADLPPTFRDAILLTRELGLRYLWIDSLCIMQDSLRDWRRESALMGKIYSNCELNIAATWASDGGSGLFGDAISPWQLRSPVECNWNTGDSSRFETNYLVRDVIWRSNVLDCELHNRGWVVPERLLSPRTVHCGASGLSWECRHRQACALRCTDGLVELSWAGVSMDRDRMAGSPRGALTKNWKDGFVERKAEYAAGAISLDKLYLPWYLMVLNYSTTRLTKSSDRLVALAGIARSIQEILGGEYVAGLWRKTLLTDLLWHAREPSAPMPSTAGSDMGSRAAPSWSWASVDATPHGINLQPPPTSPHDCHAVAEVMDVSMEPFDPDAAEVSIAGTLVLRGVILPLTSQGRRHGTTNSTGNTHPPFDMTVFPSRGALVSYEYDNPDMPIVLSGVSCLHLCVRNSGTAGYATKFVAHGLLLRRAGAGRDEFERIGIFKIHLRVLEEYYRILDAVQTAIGEDAQCRVVKIV